MPTVQVTRDPLWQFIGEDVQYPFPIGLEDGAALDVATWSWSFRIKKNLAHADTESVVTKVSGAGISVSGTFNADPALNEQRVLVAIDDTDTDLLPARKYSYELKRVDDSNETIWAHGEFDLRRGVHRG
jgi:hypothetical protein